MNITLVTCFNADWRFGRTPSPYIPLNLLGLAAGLRAGKHHVSIVDQTLSLLRGEATDGSRFHAQMADLIAATEPDVVGCTTMCNSYPQTLTLARHVRATVPHARIVFGGPQATAVDALTLTHFPWVDAVVRGEADASFPALADHWRDERPIDGLAGVTWRDADGRPRRNAAPELLQDLDALPLPAYDLYPVDEIDVPALPIEAGRGCPYGCTFCSTNLFFGRRYRIKSPTRLVSEMTHLARMLGYREFDLVHDMITVDRRWVHEFSRTLIADGHDFAWGCSARVDRVDPELLAEMAQAGCHGIFFGIETGSQRLQPIIKKQLHTDHVLPTMRECLELGMSPTASFITGFPDETVDDSLDSLGMALDVLHIDAGANAQMHMLAPLVGSPLYETYRDDLRFDGHSSDISLFLLTDDEIDAVKRHPDVFPNFYYIPTPYLDRRFTQAVSATLYGCPNLMIALRHAGADLRQVLEGWVVWQADHVDPAVLDQQYFLYRFGLDFSAYLRDTVVQDFTDAPYLATMIEYFAVTYALQRGHTTEPTVYRTFDHDTTQLNALTRTDAPWPHIAPQPTGVLFVNLPFAPLRGFAYLEVFVPPGDDAPILPGDEIEVPDLAYQLRTSSKLLVYNATQKRVLVTPHHVSSRTLSAAGLAAA